MNYIKTKGSKYPERITPWLNSLHFTFYALGVIYLHCFSTVEMPYDGVCLGVSSQLHTHGVMLVAWNMSWREYLHHGIWQMPPIGFSHPRPLLNAYQQKGGQVTHAGIHLFFRNPK